MDAADIPTRITIPFANSAGTSYIRDIPTASQTSTDPGRASYTDGFPPLTFIATDNGGTPPDGRDMNGILNATTSWSRWQSAGGTPAFDASFASAVGGYPSGAILASTTAGFLWLNTVDANTTDPDGTSASGWVPILTRTSASTYAVDTGSANAYVITVPMPLAALYDGLSVRMRAATANTGASVLTVNGLTSKSITASGGTNLVAGQILAGQIYEFQYSSAVDAFVLVAASGGLNPGTVRGTISITASTTLSIAQSGSQIIATGTSTKTVTLPNPASVAAGRYDIWNRSGGDVTVTTTGGTATFIGSTAGGATSLTYSAGSRATFTSNGTAWVVTGDVTRGDWGLNTSSGYRISPDGFITQWGSGTGVTSSSYMDNGVYESAAFQVSFPKAFPNACLSVIVSAGDVSGIGLQETAWTSSSNASQFTCRVSARGNGLTVPFTFQAFGY